MEELLQQLEGVPEEQANEIIGEYRSLVFHHAIFRNREQQQQLSSLVCSSFSVFGVLVCLLLLWTRTVFDCSLLSLSLCFCALSIPLLLFSAWRLSSLCFCAVDGCFSPRTAWPVSQQQVLFSPSFLLLPCCSCCLLLVVCFGAAIPPPPCAEIIMLCV